MNYYPFLSNYSYYDQQNYTRNCELASKIEQMQQLLNRSNRQIESLRGQNHILRLTVVQLQKKTINQEKKTKFIRKPAKNYYRRNTLTGSDKDSRIYCPYQECNHHYSSILALNFHIKYKHNGGNKKQRQAYAKIIVQAEERGQEPPKIDFNFPPGFLQKYRQAYFKLTKLTDLKKRDIQFNKQMEIELLKTQ